MIVYQAGNLWTGVRATSTDKMLARALAQTTPVLWIDPPAPRTALQRQEGMEGSAELGIDEVEPGIHRLRTTALRGFSRPGIRTAARLLHRRRVERAVTEHSAALGLTPSCFVLANSLQDFPALDTHPAPVRVLFLTDDWVAGAELLGLDPSFVQRSVRRRVAVADVVMAVSPALLETVTPWAGERTRLHTLPSGCTIAPDEALHPRPAELPEEPFAVLAGSINERTDLARIEALADRGMTVVIIGGRVDRDPAFGRRFDALVSRPTVIHLGRREQSELPAYLAAANVGLTPYTDTEFNRSSFPLKTLDYLAAGTPVVSTELPASRWFDTDLVRVEDYADAYTDAVQTALSTPKPVDLSRRCRLFAADHTWSRRVESFAAAVDTVSTPTTHADQLTSRTS